MAVLIYILLCGGSVEKSVLETPLRDRRRKIEALKMLGVTESSLVHFQSSLFHYNYFLMAYDNIERKYKLSHSSVQDSLFKCLVNYYPQEIIKRCDFTLLERLTTCKKLYWNSVVIVEDIFQDLIKRLLKILQGRSVAAFQTISRLQVWEDERFVCRCKNNQSVLKGLKENTDSRGQTMLVHFCISGNIRWVKYLLSSSSEVQRYLSLNEACAHNQGEMVDLLLSTNVRYNLKTCFYAVQSGDLDLLYRFTDNVDLTEITLSNHFHWNYMECSLLQEICFFEQNHLVEPVLARYPRLIDVRDNQGGNALHFIAYAGDKTIFKLLVRSGCDPYRTKLNGSTVLSSACKNGKLNMVRYICKKYPNLLDFKDNTAGTALHDAAWGGNTGLLKFLMKKGFSIKTKTNDGKTVLHQCCRNGKLEMCKYLVNTYPQLLYVKDKNGENALHDAAWGGNIDLLKFLMEKGFNIESYRNDGKTVLHRCCMNRKKDMCKFLVNTYPHLLDVRDNNGGTALHDAAWGGNIDLLIFLLEKGFDINSTRNDGKTVLHLCCMNEKLDICTYLLNNYPHLLDVRDKNGMYALNDAARVGNIDFIKFMLEKVFEIKSKRNDGKTVLHLLSKKGQLDMCKFLVNTLPHLLDVKDNNGETALHAAACGGNIDLLKFLMEKGFNIESKRNDGKTVLHRCCVNRKIDMCKYLVNTYPHLLDVKDNNAENALHAAAYEGNIDFFKFLLEKGLSIDSKRNDGKTVLHLCCMNGKLDMCKYLVNTYPPLLDFNDNNGENVLNDAAWGGNIDLFNFLLEKGLDIKTKRNNGKTVLHLCCMNGKLDMCKYLVKTYPHLLYIKDDIGENALHDAAWGGNIDLFYFLLEKGFDIETKRNDEKTVLHLCCMYGKLDICKYIVNTCHHLLYVKDTTGGNALHDAAWGGNIDLLKFLLEKGFDIKTKRNDGKNLLHLCCMNGKLDMCKFLVITYPHLLDVKDENGENALHTAAWGGNIDLFMFLLESFDIGTKRTDGKTILHQCCTNKTLDICKYIVHTYPHLLHIKDTTARNALYDAAWGGNINLLTCLLEKGLSINSKRNDGKTVLHLCCMHGKRDMCKYLVNTFPHLLDVKDKNGETALHDAALGGNIDLFKFLLENGFDIKTKRNDGKTVLHLCCMHGKLDMCKFLINTYPHLLDVKDNAGENALHDAVLGDNIDLLKFLLEKGFDVKTKRNDGKTVLHLCCMHGKLDMCKYMVNTYPHLLHIKDNNGGNVLHDAAWGGNIDLFKFLLENGFDIKTKRNDGKTSLHLCCMNGKLAMCDYLVNTYLHLLDVKDNKGENALHTAAWGGNIDLFKFLLEKGLDIKTIRNDGKTVLHLCCKNGKLKMCKYLVNTYPHLLLIKDNYGENALDDAARRGNIEVVTFLSEKGLKKYKKEM
ncbi:serine/threonine-protein phosphatase 6 regulatory ankyrin repeat subunit B-like [Saccostrea cucullata]|uniref:serine/threonine-protein phosphatase 6 regulatory ankyrin repeat subunit B-like n=1 Tax=Saccostrea cuccullata TaxID=36930 RepID=UPI002ED37431